MKQNNLEKFRWIPISEIQKFFNYKATQLSALLKNKTLIVAKVGKRKFVREDSLDSFMEECVNQ
jgi:hypothetical protein